MPVDVLPPGQSIQDFFQERLSGTVVDAALVALSEAYIALRNDEGDVHGVVGWVQFNPTGFEPREISYSTQHEDTGPYLHRCPERILEQLSPPATRAAQGWRARCRRYHRERAQRPTLEADDWVMFERGWSGCGWMGRGVLFKVVRWGPEGRKFRFRDQDQIWRLKRWRDRRHHRINEPADFNELLETDATARVCLNALKAREVIRQQLDQRELPVYETSFRQVFLRLAESSPKAALRMLEEEEEQARQVLDRHDLSRLLAASSSSIRLEAMRQVQLVG